MITDVVDDFMSDFVTILFEGNPPTDEEISEHTDLGEFEIIESEPPEEYKGFLNPGSIVLRRVDYYETAFEV